MDGCNEEELVYVFMKVRRVSIADWDCEALSQSGLGLTRG